VPTADPVDVGNADEGEKQQKWKIRTQELVEQMESLNNSEDESYDNILRKQKALDDVLRSLKNEYLLTDEIQEKYDGIKASLDDRLVQSKNNLTNTERLVVDAIEEAKGKSRAKWDAANSSDKDKFIKEALWSRFTLRPNADEDAEFDLEYDARKYSDGEGGVSLSGLAESFEKFTEPLSDVIQRDATELSNLYDNATEEVKQIVQKLAKIDDELSQEAWDVTEELNDKNPELAQLIEDDKNNSWTNLRNKLRTDNEPETSVGGVEQTNDSLTDQTTLLEKIQKLTTYVDEEYLSVGKHLSDFLNDLQSESNELDAELKEILATLNLIDDRGKPKFTVKNKDEEGSGTTHSGALISDDFVLIERGNYEKVKDSHLPNSTQEAAKKGINVAEVLGYLPSKYNGGFFDVQGTAKGHNLFKNGVINEDVVEATEDQLLKFVDDLVEARERGFNIEATGSNFAYDNERGFSFFDLEEWDADAQSQYQARFPDDASKRLAALENILEIFNGTNIDNTDADNDPNKQSFIDKFKNAISTDARFAGLDYQELFDDMLPDRMQADGVIETYEELCRVVERYNALIQKQAKNGGLSLDDTIELSMLQERIDMTKGEVPLLDMAKDMVDRREAFGGSNGETTTERLAKYLGIEIPNAANAAGQAIDDLGTDLKEIQEGASAASTAVDSSPVITETIPDPEMMNTNPPTGSIEVKASIEPEELRGLLDSITYKVQVVKDAEPTEDNKVSINAEELRSVLDGITYNVKIAHDDTDKESNRIDINEENLEATLNRVFANVLNPDVEQGEPEPKEAPWALESTLNTTIKGVLDQIQTNTSKIGTVEAVPSDTPGASEVTAKLVEIKSVLDSINSKIMKGGVVATRGAVKQAGAQSSEPDVKQHTARSNMMKSLINDYKTMGKLAAQFASDGNLETKAMLENIKEEIRRKRASLNITMDENATLRERYSIAFDAEKRLLEAEKQQQKINNQNKADAKAEKKRLADAKKLAQREAMVGKAGNTVGRAENTWMAAVGIEDVLPKEFDAQLDDYYQKLDALRKKQAELKNSDDISEEDKADLLAQTNNVNKLTAEISELVSEYQKLSGDNATVIGASSLGANAGIGAYEQQLKQAVTTATNGKAQIKSFDAATRTLTYTVKTGKNEFTEYTAAVRRVDGALVSVQGATKKTETFIEATKRKMKEISSYMSGMSLISRAGQELRRGIQYVREIDLALTELRKVTNETKEEYDQFLQTAAKTGARLGTTISAVTEATATFAKLGYSMEQSTEMAEAAIVYKNVGDNIESTEDAANSIISTMKGFRLEASESMAIVDRFNEVGNRFAITSQGIGEALRLSASALSEGGNSLDESIGLITAANEVVNDPSSVGK
jgi:hypothetical protein